jgi:hypothetical protein
MSILLKFKMLCKIIYAYYLENVKEYCCRMANSLNGQYVVGEYKEKKSKKCKLCWTLEWKN